MPIVSQWLLLRYHTRICIVTRLCIRSIARTRILIRIRITSRRRNHTCRFTRIRIDIISCVIINIHMRMRSRTRYDAGSYRTRSLYHNWTSISIRICAWLCARMLFDSCCYTCVGMCMVMCLRPCFMWRTRSRVRNIYTLVMTS